LVGILDFLNNSFTYIRCAAPYVYKYSRSKHKGRLDRGSGVPRIGLDLAENWYNKPAKTVSLHQGDFLVLANRDFWKFLDSVDVHHAPLYDLSLKEMLQSCSDRMKEDDRKNHTVQNDIYLFALEVK
jgi:hypothetical protein